MTTTVTLDSGIVQAIQQAIKQKDKASAVHMALNEYLRWQKLRQLADLAGTVERLWEAMQVPSRMSLYNQPSSPSFSTL